MVISKYGKSYADTKPGVEPQRCLSTPITLRQYLLSSRSQMQCHVFLLDLVGTSETAEVRLSREPTTSIYHCLCLHSGEVIPMSPPKDWILTKQDDTFMSRDKQMPTLCVCARACSLERLCLIGICMWFTFITFTVAILSILKTLKRLYLFIANHLKELVNQYWYQYSIRLIEKSFFYNTPAFP